MTTTQVPIGKTIRELTIPQALEALEKAVELRGKDFVYPDDEKINGKTCQYTREVDGTKVGSCLVGVALIDVLGLPPEHMAGSTLSASAALTRLGVTDAGVRRVFGAAQGAQDDGRSWGTSLDLARAEATLIAAVEAVTKGSTEL